MWIDDRLKDQKRWLEHQNDIRGSASDVYNALWKAVIADVAAAQNRPEFGHKPGTNGADDERIVWAPNASGARARECRLTLSENKLGIKVSGAVNLSFDIDSANGIGHLTLNGERISYEKGSELILDPLFFPDLPEGKH